eukprot:SAG31_NODE_227_length_19818_cov_6.503271_19_plen_133_part_00
MLLQRDNCTFDQKAMNAQTAGAIAAIIYNNRNHCGPQAMAGDESSTISKQITIPVVSIRQDDGNQLAAAIGASRTTVSLRSASYHQFLCCLHCPSRMYQSKFALQLLIASVFAFALKHQTHQTSTSNELALF